MEVPTRLALIGANGMLARMVRDLAPSHYAIEGYDLPDFDISNRDAVLAAMTSVRPDVIVNCAAYTNVDACETDEETAFNVNGAGPGYLAEAALLLGATLVHISTDYVFPGNKNEPCVETDPTAPLSAYGRTKVAGEEAILASGLSRFFVIRTSWLYGPGGKNFVETILRLAVDREELRIVADQHGTPTYTGDLAEAVFSLLNTQAYGIYHFSNGGSCSWFEFASRIVELAREKGLPVKVVKMVPINTEDYPLPARRPAYSVFSKSRYENATGQTVPAWQDSLNTYFSLR